MAEFDYIFKTYGLALMTPEEEMNAPANIKLIREAKVQIINQIGLIRRELDSFEMMARKAVEEDSADQAERVIKLATAVRETLNNLELAHRQVYR